MLRQPIQHEITVIEVFRLLGVNTRKDWTWSVGNRVRDIYLMEMGQLPPKDNRPKTSGKGSHCHALYPAGWKDRIAKIIRDVTNDEGKQELLF